MLIKAVIILVRTYKMAESRVNAYTIDTTGFLMVEEHICFKLIVF